MAIVATLSPLSLSDGDTLTVRLTGASEFAGRTVALALAGLDTVALTPLASIPADVDPRGDAMFQLSGIHCGRETAIFATAVRHVESNLERTVDESGFAIANPVTPVATSEGASARSDQIRQAQEERYRSGIGDASAPGSLRHRTLIAIEQLLTTRSLRLPSVNIYPIAERPEALEHLQFVNRLLSELGWATQVPADRWRQHVAGSRPRTAIVCDPIWAQNMDEADRIALQIRTDVLAILGLNRGSRGRVIAMVNEQLRSDGTVNHRIRDELGAYQGNLLGGLISGEDQHALLAQFLAVESDPLLRLCVDLYSEAIADSSFDARYFRLWSILETLSTARVSTGELVLLLDGSLWPGEDNTTDRVAPRAYQFIANHLVERIDERSFVAPASDLYEAIRAWYARRNATAHYGRFIVNDDRQKTQEWYCSALVTVSDPTTTHHWLSTFQHVVRAVLDWELMAVGAGMIAD